MGYKIFSFTSRIPKGQRLFFFLFSMTILHLSQNAHAHQTPSTIVLMDISPSKVGVELQIPLSELALVFGQNITQNPETLVQNLGPQLKEYLLAHIHIMVAKDQPWWIEITDMKVAKAEQMVSGPPFQEITVHLIMTPPAGASTRKFIFDYDVIMHQLVTHSALVSIRNDWELGKTDKQPVELGVIRVDTKTTLIYPLIINLENGSWWKGFSSMIAMGKEHIAEGTDHLLFLLVLLLPIPLVISNKNWGTHRDVKTSVIHILKIVTAFTIGHSLTLLIGAMGWLILPSRWIEMLIGVSILVSATHAIQPLFPNKETFIALGFGLIHGLAFANTLIGLNLDTASMVSSILGFNIGIELMQLLVILVTIPWLILLSRTSIYTYFRIGGAFLASIAALAWIMERYSGNENVITAFVEQISSKLM